MLHSIALPVRAEPVEVRQRNLAGGYPYTSKLSGAGSSLPHTFVDMIGKLRKIVDKLLH